MGRLLRRLWVLCFAFARFCLNKSAGDGVSEGKNDREVNISELQYGYQPTTF
jgi:hypothetical protein